MSWIEKTQPSPFDYLPIPGFFMLDGDFLFALTRDPQFQGRTRPMIAFPPVPTAPCGPAIRQNISLSFTCLAR